MATEKIADATLDYFSDTLLELDDVVYAAVVEDESGFIIEVGVLSSYFVDRSDDKRLPEKLEAPAHFIRSLNIDDAEEVPVNVVDTDPIEFLYKDKVRPANGGNSIGNHKKNSAGTLGAAVTVSSIPGKAFILTNWHVLKGSFGKKGDYVLQPGYLDGGRYPADWVATLTWWAITDKVDVAIAEVRKPIKSYVDTGTRCFGSLGSANYKPKVGMKVKKCGRTTDSTTGAIKSINASVKVGGRKFKNQIVTTSIAKGGDSGSLLLQDSGAVLGLLFAGSKKITAHNKIGEVEKALSGASALDQTVPQIALLGSDELPEM